MAKKETKKREAVEAVAVPATGLSAVLIEPWVTEASTAAMEQNQYVFRVAKDSDKPSIKRAIEQIYSVKVLGVRTIRIPRKAVQHGRTPGWKAGYKKAVITLKAGDKIELFQGA